MSSLRTTRKKVKNFIEIINYLNRVDNNDLLPLVKKQKMSKQVRRVELKRRPGTSQRSAKLVNLAKGKNADGSTI